MNVFSRTSRFLALFCLTLFSAFPAFAQTRLVISQMFGGGGNTGAPYTYDFLELYNPTATAISLSGLSIQYASATSASWNSVALPTGASVLPGHYYLIQAAAGTTVTNAPLPVTADFVISGNGSSGNAVNFSATAGKVAIVNGTTALSVSCPSIGTAAGTYVDLIGYGTANCFEGTGVAPAPSNSTADVRTSLIVDTINNATDFAVGTPNPHSSGSATGPVVPPTVAIHTIQGRKSLTASTVSTYAGQQVTTTGVVTAVLSNGFFLQARDVDDDSDPLTPEGIDIFTSSAPPAAAALGNYVTVTGTVATFPAATASHTPATEITSPTVTLIAPGVALPAPITLTTANLSPSGGLYQLTPYEGMRVAIASLTTSSGTNGSVTSTGEPTETPSSTGYFYAVITGTPQPFREPGIDVRDPAVPGRPSGVAIFDDNPERILVNSILTGAPSIEVSTGAVLTNVTGVLDFTFSSDSFYDPSRLILDASYNRANVTPGITVQPVALPAANEFTVASFNIERFYNTNAADDLYFVPAGVTGYNGNSSTGSLSAGQTYQSAAVDITAAAYATRLKKVSLAIRTVLNSPDVVTLEEVENQSVANDIAAQVNADAGIPNLYTGLSTDNSTYYSQDGTGISVGFLVKNTVDNLGFSQYGALETFTPSTSSSPITLNDRPWLVLKAGLKRANAKDYPVTVIVNHMKALTGQNSATSTSTRQKKELQAEDIAKYIQTQQAAGAHVISGGDFNAFEFSDGYNDTLATYTNVNVLPSTQVLQPGVAGLVTPPLTDLALTLPANQRWSYLEDGSRQILDHMVVTSDLVAGGAHFAYAHLDADFPLTAYNDPTTAARTSDHDVAVGYFVLPAPVLSATIAPTTAAAFATTQLGASSTGQVFTFTNTGEAPITISGVTATGDYAVSTSCGATLAIGATCSANVVFSPTAPGTRTGTLTFATNVTGSTYALALTGTGAPAVLPALSASAITFPSVVTGVTSTMTVTLSSASLLATPISSITVTGDYTQTNTCGTSLPASGSCVITIVFKPTAGGARTGTLTVVSTGVSAATVTASLTGTGLVPDFSIADSTGKTSTTATAVNGTTINVPLTFTSINTFTGTITLSCAITGGSPIGTTCFAGPSFTLGATPVVVNVQIGTTGRTYSYAKGAKGSGISLAGSTAPVKSVFILACGGLLLLFATRARRMGRMTRIGGLLSLALAVCLGISGCGSSSVLTNPNGTLAGSYTYVVTATSGTLVHTETITLTVQ